jgi:hypothetical protein
VPTVGIWQGESALPRVVMSLPLKKAASRLRLSMGVVSFFCGPVGAVARWDAQGSGLRPLSLERGNVFWVGSGRRQCDGWRSARASLRGASFAEPRAGGSGDRRRGRVRGPRRLLAVHCDQAGMPDVRADAWFVPSFRGPDSATGALPL